jgi:predicted Zn-ribbon and HTH transcriptional regulator
MPIPAAPTRTRCPSCGWVTVTHHRSDVIFLPSKCGKCGGDCLEHSDAAATSFNLAAFIRNTFKH